MLIDEMFSDEIFFYSIGILAHELFRHPSALELSRLLNLSPLRNKIQLWTGNYSLKSVMIAKSSQMYNLVLSSAWFGN